MENNLKPRRLHNSIYCVEEVGQYRIGYILRKIEKIKEIHFIGDHKQYKKWYSKL